MNDEVGEIPPHEGPLKDLQGKKFLKVLKHAHDLVRLELESGNKTDIVLYTFTTTRNNLKDIYYSLCNNDQGYPYLKERFKKLLGRMYQPLMTPDDRVHQLNSAMEVLETSYSEIQRSEEQ